MIHYTEEEKKQLKAAFGRMLDNDKDFLILEIAEVGKEWPIPSISRKMFTVSVRKEGNVEKR